MHNQLTRQDIRRMEEEIEYRKLVVRKEALEAVKERNSLSLLLQFYMFRLNRLLQNALSPYY